MRGELTIRGIIQPVGLSSMCSGVRQTCWTKADEEVISFPELDDENGIYLGIRRVGGTGVEPVTPAL